MPRDRTWEGRTSSHYGAGAGAPSSLAAPVDGVLIARGCGSAAGALGLPASLEGIKGSFGGGGTGASTALAAQAPPSATPGVEWSLGVSSSASHPCLELPSVCPALPPLAFLHPSVHYG